MINKYLEFFKLEIKEDLADRSRFLVWLVSKPIMMIMQIVIWTAIFTYSQKDSIGGFNLGQTINYFLFMQIFGGLVYNHLSESMGSRIYSGKLTIKLLKPVNYALGIVSNALGGRFFSLIYESIPALIIGLIFFNFTIYSMPMILISIISIFLGLFVNCFFSLCWALMYFKMINYGPFERIKRFMLGFISGYLIPINFMPQALQNILKYLPFNYIFFEPSRIYLNIYNNYQVLQIILTQILWIIVLYLIFDIFFKKNLKTYEGVGA